MLLLCTIHVIMQLQTLGTFVVLNQDCCCVIISCRDAADSSVGSRDHGSESLWISIPLINIIILDSDIDCGSGASSRKCDIVQSCLVVGRSWVGGEQTFTLRRKTLKTPDMSIVNMSKAWLIVKPL